MRIVADFASANIDVLYDGHSDYVTLRFQAHESDDYVDVTFNRFNLPALFRGILEATQTEQPAAIRADDLNSWLFWKVTQRGVGQMET